MRLCLIFLICLPLLSLTLAKKVEIDNLYRAILKDQEGIEHKNLLIDLLIDNVLGLCYVSCPGGGKFQLKGHLKINRKFKASLVPRPDPIVDINGCGSYNIHIDFELFNAGEFNQCCNGHDVCYESCDSTKNKCDTTFERCLKDVCNTWAAEQNWGLIQKTGTISFSTAKI